MENCRGNVLFLILIAVVLFAALSYAVTRSSQSGNEGVEREQAALAASRIFNYTSALSQNLQRMLLIGSVPLEQLDFDSPNRLRADGTTYPHDNTLCLTDECEVHDVNGGNFAYQDFANISAQLSPSWASSWEGPGTWSVNIIKFENQGTDLPDLVFRMANMDEGVCQVINEKAGADESPAIVNTGETVYFMRGDPTAGLSANDAYTFGDSNDTGLNGATSFCSDSSLGWVLYSLLLAR